MASSKGKSSTTARRREVRKSVPRPGPWWQQTIRRREVLWATAFVALFVTIAGLVAFWLGGSNHYYPSQVLTEPVMVRVTFEREDVEQTKKLRAKAREDLAPTYSADQDYRTELQNRLNGLLELAKYDTLDSVPAEYRENIKLSELVLHELKQYMNNGEPIPRWQDNTRSFLQEVFELAILDPNDVHPFDAPIGLAAVNIIHPDPMPGKKKEPVLYANDTRILSVEDVETLELHLKYATRYFAGEHLKDTIVAMVLQDPHATYHYNQELSSLRGDEAAAAQEPYIVTYEADTALFKTGDELTRADVSLIQSEKRAYRAHLSSGQSFLVGSGRLGLILMVGIAVWVYIFFCNERIVRNPMRGLAITSLLLICQFIAVAFIRAMVSCTLPACKVGGRTRSTTAVFNACAIPVNRYKCRWAGALMKTVS